MDKERANFGLNAVNDAWKDTCRIILRREIGDLWGYSDYLSKHNEPRGERISTISGKKVFLAAAPICKGAKFISNDEMEEYTRRTDAAGFNINDIKDIDSVVRAFGENFCYSGNIVGGDSREVYESDCCFNSGFVYRSTGVYDSKYIVYSSEDRWGEYLFGCNWTGENRYLIKCYETYKLLRCMEALRTYIGSDCYYVANLEDCSDCMFTFNQRSKRNLIGNLKLPKEKYEGMKEKLVAEIADTLERKKAVPTMVDIIKE